MSLSTVINERNKDRYTVDSYHLKVLKCDLPDLRPVDSGVVHQGFKTFEEIDEARAKEAPSKATPSSQTAPSQQSSDQQNSSKEVPVGDNLEPVVNESHDELIESLLKKADDFSSKYLKAQMELESFKEESAAKEQTIREEAYKEGVEAAKQEASNEAQQLQSEVLAQLQTSIESLSNASSEFGSALHKVEEELISAALEIAKEVIVKELDDNANEIALKLASSLMKEIDKKSEIILKVHPNQIETFTTALVASKNIKVQADKAVSEGGVIIQSQMGTIEADIMQRFEHIKRNALS
jgi:flagellar assembly protein FliH